MDGAWRGSTAQVNHIQRKIIIQMLAPPESNKQEIPLGSTLIVKIKPFINRSPNKLSTQTFTVATFTDHTLRYAVDQITSGLILFSCEAGFYLQDT